MCVLVTGAPEMSAQPKRIQMSRQRPWRAENPDAVIVARPTKWGNPFKVGEAALYSIETAREVLLEDRAHVVAVYRDWLSERGYPLKDRPPTLDEIRAELAGRDLACWCPLDQPCHADVLLDLANSETP